MAAKMDSKIAVAIMNKAGFNPLVPYPGIKKPWLSRHTECNQNVSPTLYAIQKGGGCGYCSGRYLSQDAINEVFAKANLLPISDYKNNNTPIECKCLVCGNIVHPIYASVKSTGKGCKYCAKNYLSPDEIAKRFRDANLKPLEEFINTKTKIKCECLLCGDIVSPILSQIKNNDRGCKKCANIEKSKRSLKNSNLEKYTKIISQRGGKLHATEYRGLKGSYFIECENGHTWYSTLSGLGTTRWCEICARKNRSEKLRKPLSEIKTLFEDANIEILSEFKTVNSSIKGRCLRCGNEVNVIPNNLKRGQGGCKVCGSKVTGSKLRISEEDARKKFRENGYEILEAYLSNNIPVKARCVNCGEIGFPRLHNLTPGALTCKHCVPHATLSQQAVAKIFLDSGYTLIDTYERSGKPVQCIHSACGNTVKISHNSLMSGRGCRFCNYGGFDFNSPGYLYIMYHEVFDSIKVGISGTGSKRDRLKDHSRHNWKLYEKFNFEKGDDAYQVEQSFFRFVRVELNIAVHLVSEQMPQGGFSETISGDEISLLEVKRLVQDTISGRINLD